MSDQTTLEVVLSSESTVGTPIIETVTVIGTVPIGPRGIDGTGTGLVDGDYGDVSVSGTGTVMTIDNGAVTPAKLSFDPATQAELDAEAALARNADNLTSGTVADARIASTIARDSEVSAAVAASEAGQVRDGDAAGGVLSGTYPNPSFAADMATQAELDAVAATIPATEAIQDVVGAMATDGTTVNFTYDDTAGTLTAEVQGLTSGSLSDFAEAVRDRLGATLAAGTGITVTVDDPGDTVTIATTITQYTDEMARDAIGAALVAGTNITITPNDGANTITIDATGGSSYTDENAQDAVGTILADSATIDFTYTDATPEITAVVKDGSITAAKVAADVATQAELDAKVSDTAYDATSWNGVTDVAPSKNAVRDELEATATEIATAIADGDASTLTSANAHSDALVSDTAYNAGTWDGDTTHAPSKNAVRDKIESMGAASVSDTAYAGSWDGVTTVAPSKNAVYDEMELRAPKASPTFTGTPAAPTASQGTNTTQVATTAYVQTEAGLLVPKSVLTTDGDLLTRASGVPARITRASLAADSAFSSLYAPLTPRLIDIDRARRTAGNITINSTSWANLDTGLDLTLTAAAGDILEVCLSAYVLPNASNQYAALDVATIVGGSPVTYVSSGTGTPAGNGVGSWNIAGNRGEGPIGGSVEQALVSGDISGGTVTVRLRYKTANAVDHTVRANSSDPFQWFAKVYRP